MVTILGKSEPVITMVLDNVNPEMVVVINNLNIPDKLPYKTKSTIFIEKKTLPKSQKNFVLGVTKPENKKKIRELYENIKDDKFINCIHKNTSISKTCTLGNGLIINSFVSIASYSKLGNFVTVNRNASIGHHTEIGDYTTINPNACVCGEIKIGKYCMIGAGAIIIERLSICDNVIIGAGSLVRKDIDEPGTYVGNPLIKIK